MAKSNKILRTALLASLALHLLMFLMYFVPNYVIGVNKELIGYKIYAAIGAYITRFLEFAIPALACAAVYFSNPQQKALKAVLKCLSLALCKLIYYIPHYYLVFMQGNTIDSVNALFMSGIFSILFVILSWIHIMLLFASLRIVARISRYRNSIKELTPQKKEKLTKKDKKNMLACAKAEIDAYPELGNDFDFSYPLCVGLFAPTFIQFIIYLVQELITTVDYLKPDSGLYNVEDIITMIFTYLFIFASMLITHKLIVMIFVKTREVKSENE